MTQWAIVTGASGGLGEGFARELAGMGSNVALVARSEDKLRALAEDLEHKHKVQAEVIVADLSSHDGRAPVIEFITNNQVHTLVNNAGFGTLKEFAEIEPQRVTQEVELNVVALTEFTRAVVPQMVDRGRGAIINVASTAAFQPIPQMAVYAATKAYVKNLSIALWAELKDAGVRVVAVCPGPTETNFFEVIGDNNVMSRRRSVNDVMRSTFKALAANQPYVIDGLANTALARLAQVAPASFVARSAQWVATHK